MALGRDIAGRAVMANLADMPHILISGATGAGKSSCINSLITSILMRATPEQVRLILVDPKRVELGQYNGLPHLLTQVVVDPKKAANALSWAVTEMERRYDLLAEAGMRDITGYNEAVDRGDFDDAAVDVSTTSTRTTKTTTSRRRGTGPEDDEVDGEDHRRRGGVGAGCDPGRSARCGGDGRVTCRGRPGVVHRERLPFVLVVVDELNDLMMVAARDVEESVCRIAQMARAVGIHLVLATQRPSVDVITGVIKANVPSRLAFSVSSLADSRVILDQPGAERLIGKGDMLLLTASSSVPRRIQGPWVSEDEVRDRGRLTGAASAAPSTSTASPATTAPPRWRRRPTTTTSCCPAAMELVVRSQLGSTSMLQRKLRVGFSRAGRLDGPARAARGGGPVRGIEGPCRAHDPRRARTARLSLSRGPPPRSPQPGGARPSRDRQRSRRGHHAELGGGGRDGPWRTRRRRSASRRRHGRHCARSGATRPVHRSRGRAGAGAHQLARPGTTGGPRCGAGVAVGRGSGTGRRVAFGAARAARASRDATHAVGARRPGAGTDDPAARERH